MPHAVVGDLEAAGEMRAIAAALLPFVVRVVSDAAVAEAFDVAMSDRAMPGAGSQDRHLPARTPQATGPASGQWILKPAAPVRRDGHEVPFAVVGMTA
jgi:hypothetical protein